MKLKLMIILLLPTIIYAEIKFNHRRDPWGTHQPVLYEIARKTTGPIIEFGSGNNSTALLHEVCKKDKRLLITLDDDAQWLHTLSQQYLHDGYEADNSGWHKFIFVPGKTDDTNDDHWVRCLETNEYIQHVSFDLCFVDQAPWIARKHTVEHLKDKVTYIILHDCDMFGIDWLGTTLVPYRLKDTPAVFDFSPTFKYFKVYFPLKPWPGQTGPPTLLGSNFTSDLPDIDYNQY